MQGSACACILEIQMRAPPCMISGALCPKATSNAAGKGGKGNLMSDYYEFIVRGHLDGGWTTWFDGLAITNQADGTTLLAGRVKDQAALHGLLVKIRDLGLPLITVQRQDDPAPSTPEEGPAGR